MTEDDRNVIGIWFLDELNLELYFSLNFPFLCISLRKKRGKVHFSFHLKRVIDFPWFAFSHFLSATFLCKNISSKIKEGTFICIFLRKKNRGKVHFPSLLKGWSIFSLTLYRDAKNIIFAKPFPQCQNKSWLFVWRMNVHSPLP